MIYKRHLNTTFMQSSIILYAENIDGSKGGVGRMEKVKLYSKSFENDEQGTFHLSYFLLIRSAEQGKIYGIEITKTDAAGNMEKDAVEGLCESRDEAEGFLFRLAEGLALPVALAALCDDHISEREFGKKFKMVQAAS